MVNEAVTYEFQEEAVKVEPVEESRRSLSKVYLYLLSGLVLALPVFFGGVNITANYISYFAAFSVLSLTFYKGHFVSDRVLRAFLYLLAFCCLQYLFLDMPVRELFRETALSVAFFFAVYYIAKIYLGADGRRVEVLVELITISAFIVSLIGLSHWFYDNGKLFWYFEPNSFKISERARWPFVNSNHLGNFLLLAIFIQLSKVRAIVSNLLKARHDYVGRKGSFLSNYLSSARIQGKLLKLAMGFIMLLSISICLTATLSRGSWTGFGAGVAVFLISSMFISYKKKSANLIVVPDEAELEKRRIRRMILGYRVEYSRIAKKAFKPAVVVLGALVFLFFLNEEGQERVTGRIEYGLKYSLDDMRWTMYNDTLQMFRDYPLFGVGLGQWQKVYPRYMDESLSGINPVYLHSEPIQMLAELGIVGSFLIISALVYIIRNAFILIRKTESSENRMLIGLVSGLIAFLVASFVEFPLRMPGIQVFLAINLALIMWEMERVKKAAYEDMLSK